MTIKIVVSACSTLEIPGRAGESVLSWKQLAEAFSDIDGLYCGTAGMLRPRHNSVGHSRAYVSLALPSVRLSTTSGTAPKPQ
jgi:hypothetical protein